MVSKYIHTDTRYFVGYEVTKKALTPANSSSSDLNLCAVLFAGGMAGVTMWSIAIPPDVLLMSLSSIEQFD